MRTNDESWLAVADAIQAAGVDSTHWYPALESLASLTGSRTGQLICIGDDGNLPLNIMTNVDPGMLAAFTACDGGNPDINPRVNAGRRSPILETRAEADFMTPDEHARHAHYLEFAHPWDIPYICLATLEREPDLLVGLAVCRSGREGHITDRQREIFASLAPHVRSAVRTQRLLANQGAVLLAGAMEALSVPAFVCDHTGQVRAMSPAGEALLDARRGITVRAGALIPTNPLEASALRDAIDAAAAERTGPRLPQHRSVVLRSGPQDSSPLVLEVISLPRSEYDFSFTPRVLIVARGPQDSSERRAMVLRTAYALTGAETDIAMQLIAGRTAEAIATHRSASVGTVRGQIKSLMAKVGVSRQIELVARLNAV